MGESIISSKGIYLVDKDLFIFHIRLSKLEKREINVDHDHDLSTIDYNIHAAIQD